MPKDEGWWQHKSEKGRALVDEITALAQRARATGFQATEYILRMAASELLKEIENERGDKNAL
jgi:hypothetical protein